MLDGWRRVLPKSARQSRYPHDAVICPDEFRRIERDANAQFLDWKKDKAQIQDINYHLKDEKSMEEPGHGAEAEAGRCVHGHQGVFNRDVPFHFIFRFSNSRFRKGRRFFTTSS
jgi:hypothetical protein